MMIFKNIIVKLHLSLLMFALLFIFCTEGTPEYCSNGHSYNSHTQFCHNGEAFDKCNGEAYDVDEQFCHNNATYPRCGRGAFNPAIQFCANNIIYAKCAGAEFDPNLQGCAHDVLRPRCGKSLYDSNIEFCHNDFKVYEKCNGEIFDPEDGCDGADAQPRCGGLFYNTNVMFCADQTTYWKCGGEEFYPPAQFCVNNRLFEKCAGEEYHPSERFCVDNRLYEICGVNEYDPNTQFCHSNRIYDKCEGKEFTPPNDPCAGWMVDTDVPGLYAKAPPIYASDVPVDLSNTQGATIIDKVFAHVNANQGSFTLLLDSDVNVAGSNNRRLERRDAKLTIMGLGTMRELGRSSTSGYFAYIGSIGRTGIELILGNNITLSAPIDIAYNAVLTLQGNAVVNGRMLGDGNDGGRSVLDGNIIMQDHASILGNITIVSAYASALAPASLTMRNNALITGNVQCATTGGIDIATFTMTDNASVLGGVNSSVCNFTMNDHTSVSNNSGNGVNGSVTMNDYASVSNSSGIGISGSVTMNDYASVSNNNGGGVSGSIIMNDYTTVSNNNGVGVSVSGNFTMNGYASVFGSTNGGVYIGRSSHIDHGNFSMHDNTTIFNNNVVSDIRRGGGVSVVGGVFTMHDNASIFNNTGTRGGGVYIERYSVSFVDGTGILQHATFSMYDNSLIYGNTADQYGGGLYVVGDDNIFIMEGGVIYGVDAFPEVYRNISETGAVLYINNSNTVQYGDGTNILPHIDGHEDYTDFTITGRK